MSDRDRDRGAAAILEVAEEKAVELPADDAAAVDLVEGKSRTRKPRAKAKRKPAKKARG